ncbi:MbcA/ParS/Xre antitoxin family protein [Roseovarius sp.]|uniref:MbcA/ParS/Xre antitoxin family protein n=1 Tax=Roseovarius sp. TaxID=1486281 RepID=UPI003BAC21C7
MTTLAQPRVDQSRQPGRVLAKAAFNAAGELGLSQKELARIIGVSEATVSRMKGGGYDLSGKSNELAICLVRVFRSLDAISGSDLATMRGWVRNPNTDLNAAPVELLLTAPGLITVMNYLDAARAPL